MTDERRIEDLYDRYGKREIVELNELLNEDSGADLSGTVPVSDSKKPLMCDMDNDGVWEEYIKLTGQAEVVEEGMPERGLHRYYDVLLGEGEWKYNGRHGGKSRLFYIMDNSIWRDNHINDFIFPQLPIESDNLGITKLPLFLEDFVYVDLREGTKYGTTILYELGQDKSIKCIDADKYTVFVAKEDGALWYWNSKMIDYHDCKDAIADVESCREDYSGYWEKVNIKEILNVTDENVNAPYVISMCAGSENVLFLTNEGQVFMSKYVINEIKDIEYYNQENTNPNRERVKIIRDFPLKTMAFQKLDWENITRINSDGLYCFSAVDESGMYFVF